MSGETVDNSIAVQGQSLFGRPTSKVSEMERSREALLLRLEQMNNKERKPHNSNGNENREMVYSDNSALSPSMTKSRAIPIKKKSRPTTTHEGRGFTDDMMFFASGCMSDDNEDESEGKNVDEPFVPPHLQQIDSFTFRSYV